MPYRPTTPIPSARPRRAAVIATATLAGLGALTGCGAHHLNTSPIPSTSTSTSTAPSTTSPRPAPGGPKAPLTGLPVPAARARHRAVVVKIDNIAPALPQTGVDAADVVYEEMVEGGLTRLAAVFQSTWPATVGPVRSGRLTDIGIADDLGHPVLGYAGANAIFQPQLTAADLTVADDDNEPGLFWRDAQRVEPHNLFTNVARLASVGKGGAPRALWDFRRPGSPFANAGARSVAGATVDFPAATAAWIWNAHDNVWLRSQDGARDVASDHHRLAAANVIIQWVPYVTSAYVTGEGASAQGTPIPTGELAGSGTAWFLSGGRLVKGSWRRATLSSRTVYTDAKGHPIRLSPGRTWVELPPVGTTVTVTP